VICQLPRADPHQHRHAARACDRDRDIAESVVLERLVLQQEVELMRAPSSLPSSPSSTTTSVAACPRTSPR
jgi:hypothetical protein